LHGPLRPHFRRPDELAEYRRAVAAVGIETAELL
jgi:hypothetical protein